MSSDIEYKTNADLSPAKLLEFYSRQHHSANHSREEIQRMLDDTCCLVTAERNGDLIGFARGVVSGVVGYLAECKLDPVYQGPACVTKTDGRIEHDDSGIAREMAIRVIEKLRAQGVEKIGTVAYGTEVDFCEELGFKQPAGVVWLELSASVPFPSRNEAVSGAAG